MRFQKYPDTCGRGLSANKALKCLYKHQAQIFEIGEKASIFSEWECLSFPGLKKNLQKN